MSISMDSLPPRYQKQAARKLDPAAYEKALQFFHAEETKSPARQAQGSISHALGESFEAQILTACEYYRSICHAEIDKTPEPIKVISGRHQNPSGCWSFEAVFTKQAQKLIDYAREEHCARAVLATQLDVLRENNAFIRQQSERKDKTIGDLRQQLSFLRQALQEAGV